MEESNDITEMALDIKTLLEKFDNIENRLANVEEKLGLQLKSVNKKIEKLEQSQDFISKLFETNKLQTENFMKKDEASEKNIRDLTEKVKQLEKDLKQEKCDRNKVAQYHRTSLNVKIMGLKLSADE